MFEGKVMYSGNKFEETFNVKPHKDGSDVDQISLLQLALGTRTIPPAIRLASGCLEVQKVIKNTNKYLHVTVDKRKHNGMAQTSGHRLILKVIMGYDYVEGNFPVKLDFECSHRCHNKMCIEPRHLIFEDKSNNTNRNACNLFGFCGAPKVHKGPPCIL